jgi:hypothetical protein
MPPASPPPGFDQTRAPTAEDLRSLTSIGHAAGQTLEHRIAEHHFAEIDYTDAEGEPTRIRLRPAYNQTHHVVVWGMPTSADHWEELRFDRIHEVQDTGEVFEPTW